MSLSPSVPSPEVMVFSTESKYLVSASPLALTCSIQLSRNNFVDTPTFVVSSWDAPNNSTYDRVNTANPLNVVLFIPSVRTADSGNYICLAYVAASGDSEFIVDSDQATDMVNIVVSKSFCT